MKGGLFPNCGFRFSATHIRHTHLPELHGWRAGGFQNVALTSTPRSSVSTVCNMVTDPSGRHHRNGVRL
eukprot:9087527-Pyramimonas_sp.AAC.1